MADWIFWQVNAKIYMIVNLIGFVKRVYYECIQDEDILNTVEPPIAIID